MGEAPGKTNDRKPEWFIVSKRWGRQGKSNDRKPEWFVMYPRDGGGKGNPTIENLSGSLLCIQEMGEAREIQR